jgi:hypothetical protein
VPASDVVVPKKIDTQREGASIYQREFLVYRLARVQNTGGPAVAGGYAEGDNRGTNTPMDRFLEGRETSCGFRLLCALAVMPLTSPKVTPWCHFLSIPRPRGGLSIAKSPPALGLSLERGGQAGTWLWVTRRKP